MAGMGPMGQFGMNQGQPMMQMAPQLMGGRRGSPSYYRALQDLGGVEDALEGMEESLQKYELRSIGNVHRRCGFEPWSGAQSRPMSGNMMMPGGDPMMQQRSPQKFPNRMHD